MNDVLFRKHDCEQNKDQAQETIRLIEKQINEKSPKVLHLSTGSNAVNGLFYFCDAPVDYNNYGYNALFEDWQFSFCRPDDFGNLVPVDPFYHGWEHEQHDVELESWFGGALQRLIRVDAQIGWEFINRSPVVDSLLNVYMLHVFPQPPEKATRFSLIPMKKGPYSQAIQEQWLTLEQLEQQEVRFFEPFVVLSKFNLE